MHKSSSLTLLEISNTDWLLPGETIKIEENKIGYVSPIATIEGKVFVTNYRLRFEAVDPSVKHAKCCQFDIPLGCISRVEKVGNMNYNIFEKYGLEIVCKDLRNIRFLHQQSGHSRRPLYENLQKYAFPLTNNLPFFATEYKERFTFDGWSLFDTVSEFKRMHVPNETWVITHTNNYYEMAETYPAFLAVPAAALAEGKDFLLKVGDYRSKRRIPVLSWINPVTQATITRSSQPLVGITSKKSDEDQRYLRMIVDANAHAHQLLIFDARPSVNAKVNKAIGGGYENSHNNCQLVFLDIQNIHIVRESLKKLRDAFYPDVDDKNWFHALDETKWLYHIQTILDGSKQIAREVEDNRASVLVHCSDGWDRTAQLTSLAMLQLDPYYRTLQGFGVLVEKEWCSFGHKFSQRIGHGEDKAGDSERSPIFVQFIDCVWQLHRQFPYAFEFNCCFLITVLDELYSCRFGTFLYNSEKQRVKEHKVKKTTHSLWSYIMDNKHKFLNPLYNRYPRFIDVLRPNTKMAQIHIWKEYYFRHSPRVATQPRTDTEQLLSEKLLIRLDELSKIIKDQELLSGGSGEGECSTMRRNSPTLIKQ